MTFIKRWPQLVGQCRRSYATGTPLKRTPLFDLHVKNGAKMVPFAGFEMPVLYADLGLTESHKWTRGKSSIFDVSHMVQFKLSGPSATDFLERITPAGCRELQQFSSTLSVITNAQGGIIDDTIITKHNDESFYVVTNAACRDKDLLHIETQLREWGKPLKLELLDDHALIAVQGPSSAAVLQEHTKDALSELKFGNSRYIDIAGINCHVARGGYTGEDGFEISCPAAQATTLTELLLATDVESIKLAGLGARDSLRLEAGMCLYGNDLNDTTSPNEAGLLWTIPKRRRAEGGFMGDTAIQAQIKEGVSRRRVGLLVEGAPARAGADILSVDGDVVGRVTSGCPSPTLGRNIAMGYISTGYHKNGMQVGIKVRNKVGDAQVTKMPFVPTQYYK
ncbi:Probable aminomethyltransferase,mitochondrial [Taphrina deformans PYCC 5710]|uniref:Aminomethyltransferase n=1 Tax=Taphrina deformans (strain PYCC 5710 / ATCC 11124 / CBS 356.35 / IMI 108563 / JCM 9778 / NBRC 8474) TaxID=1097556 RepID=R4X9S6_TAPDE|nr:Probable aminomethyltransferase,mitochondrial [Taphrina deformans PYCC 5710]|eukprot:CCG82222.1 Probable aminomethyltransferase,mitochondrial [Taphrina deformans PYCC 5710]